MELKELEELLFRDLKKAHEKGYKLKPGEKEYGVIAYSGTVEPQFKGCTVCAIGAYLLMEHEGEPLTDGGRSVVYEAARRLGVEWDQLGALSEGFEVPKTNYGGKLFSVAEYRDDLMPWAEAGWRLARRVEIEILEVERAKKKAEEPA